MFTKPKLYQVKETSLEINNFFPFLLNLNQSYYHYHHHSSFFCVSSLIIKLIYPKDFHLHWFSCSSYLKDLFKLTFFDLLNDLIIHNQGLYFALYLNTLSYYFTFYLNSIVNLLKYYYYYSFRYLHYFIRNFVIINYWEVKVLINGNNCYCLVNIT